MALIFCPPKGHKLEEKTEGIEIQGFAKAKGIRFLPWKLIRCGSDRQEEQIATYCRAHGGFPIRVMDWTDERLVSEFLEHNPEALERASTPAGLAALMARAQAPADTSVRFEGTTPEKTPARKITHQLSAGPGKKGPVAQSAEPVVLES